jgi:hypothetical protein
VSLSLSSSCGCLRSPSCSLLLCGNGRARPLRPSKCFFHSFFFRGGVGNFVRVRPWTVLDGSRSHVWLRSSLRGRAFCVPASRLATLTWFAGLSPEVLFLGANLGPANTVDTRGSAVSPFPLLLLFSPLPPFRQQKTPTTVKLFHRSRCFHEMYSLTE